MLALHGSHNAKMLWCLLHICKLLEYLGFYDTWGPQYANMPIKLTS